MTAAREFIRDFRGNMSVLFAASLFPMVLLAGGLIDYSYQMKTKVKLQAALDNAILGAVASANGSPQAQAAFIKAKLPIWLNSNLTGKDRDNIRIDKINVSVGKDGTVTANVQAQVKTTFLKLVRINRLNLKVFTETKRSYGVTEVALVLDNTGSMSGAKLAELKRAAKLFINTIYDKVKDRPDKDNFKVAIVPFTQYVNVGKQYRNASWIAVPKDRYERYRHCYWSRQCVRYAHRRVCYWTGGGDWGPRRRICYTARYCKRYGPRKRRCYWAVRRTQWKGCVGSRNYPYNLTDTGYGANKVPGVMNRARNGYGSYNYCPSATITPLQSIVTKKSTLVSKLNRMTASGYTYIPAGLIWGRRVLSHQAPFTQGASDDEVRNKNIQRVIVLMTDGENTRSPTYPDHDGWNRNTADNITKALCNRIKAKNPATGRPFADIITVTFDVHNANVKSMLRACASMGSYDAQSGNLEAAFKSIGVKLARLHLSR